jgi:hypothetical protein
LYNSPLYNNVPWSQLDPEEQALIRRAGGGEITWNAEKVYGNARNVEGTLQDPVMLIPVAGGVRIGIKTFQYLVGIATAACADGNCSNEIESAAETTRRVFWSGGNPARLAAEAWAKANNATTLEMTKAGQRLTEMTKGLDFLTQARPLWDAASARFAQGAAGEVHVFHNAMGVSLQSVWARVEYLALTVNQNVTNIVYHVVMPDGSIATPP